MTRTQTSNRVAIFGSLAALICFLLFDRTAFAILQTQSDTWLKFWQTLSSFGLSGWMIVGSASLVLLAAILAKTGYSNARRLRQGAGLVFASVVLTGLATQLLKQIVGRARPELFDQLGPHSFSPFAFDTSFASMPSGHTSSVFAFATSMAVLVPAIRWPLLILASLSGLSRTYVGMHYLSDVIAGATLGFLGTVWLARRLHKF